MVGCLAHFGGGFDSEIPADPAVMPYVALRVGEDVMVKPPAAHDVGELLGIESVKKQRLSDDGWIHGRGRLAGRPE
jgi:hypothetical protein